MASDFVRNIKDVRNIDVLSPNITTENDLISTSDGEVYVVTKKGYKKITGVETKEIKQLKTDVSNLKKQSDTNTLNISDLENKTSDIETLSTSINTNTSEIETVKKSSNNNTSEISNLKQQIVDLAQSTKTSYVLFEGSEQGVGSTIQLNDNFHNYYMIFISGEFPGGVFTEPILVKALLNDITIQRINLRDSDGTFLGAYEVKLVSQDNNVLEIVNDVSWDELGSQGSGGNRNAFLITNIEGVK